jgi:TP901 family phage tail tape measure protein
MATVIQEAIFKIKLDDSEVKKGVQGVEDDLTGLSRIGSKMTGFGSMLTQAVTLPIIAIGTAAVTAAISFESAFAGVRKTVNASEEDFAKLSAGIRAMSLEVPVTAEEIAGVAEAAGQLGIETANIMSFTRTMVDLGVATNLTSHEAATLIAQFANVTGLPQTEFSNLGSTIVALGNNFATTEADIVSLAQRLAAAGTVAGVTAPEIMGFAAALSSVGINAEAGGTAFSKLFVDIYAATQKGGKELDQFAKVAGMSAEQFRVAYQNNATGAIVAFVEGLGKIEKSGGSVIGTLDELGITEVRMRNALLSSANAGELLSNAIKMANAAYGENNALTKEAAQRYATTASQITLLWNNVKALGYEFGEIMLPALRSVVSALTSAVQWFQGFDSTTKSVIIVVAGLAAAVGPLLLALGTLASIMPTLAAGFALLTAPILIKIAAVAALAAAIYLIYDNWGGIVDWFEDIWYKIKISSLLAIDTMLRGLESLTSFIPGMSVAFTMLRGKISEAIDAAEVSRRAQLVERGMERVADESKKAAAEMDKMGKNSKTAGETAEEAAIKAARAQEEHRAKIAAVNEAIQRVVDSYRSSMATFDREIEIGIRIADNGANRLKAEIDALTKALTQAASDVNVNIDSAPILALRQRLQEARGELMGLRQESGASEIAIRSMSGEIKSANDSLGLLSKITGEAIAAKTFREAKDASEDYGNGIKEITKKTSEFGQNLKDSIIPALQLMSDKSVSVGDKINGMASIALQAIPGIGGVLSSVLGILDNLGFGLDDIIRKIGKMFAPGKGQKEDTAPTWFREVEDLISRYKLMGMEAEEIVFNLKILFPNISEDTLNALVKGTTEAFAEYTKWLSSNPFAHIKGASTFSEMLIEELERGLTQEGAIQAVIQRLFAMSSKEIEKLTGWDKQMQKNKGYGGLEYEYRQVLEEMLKKMNYFGVKIGESWDGIISDSDKAAIELENAILRINKALTQNLDSINERLKAGIITKEMADTQVLDQYKRAIDNMFDAGIKADDPRLIAMIDAWRQLGGGAKGAAEDTEEATDAMAEAIRKQEKVYADTLAKLAKLEQDNAAMVALGVKSQTDSQKELLRAYTRAIEELVDAGLKPNDPRLVAMVNAWKELGGTISETTDKVKETVTEQDKAAAKLQSTYDAMAESVAKQMEAIRASWESGATDGLTAMQKEAVLLRDSIESLLRNGMNPDDSRIQGWQARLNDINQNMKDLGKNTYEVIDPTNKVALAWRSAGDRLTETLDYIEKRDLAGLFGKQTDMLREQANAYKRAIEDFLKAGDPDDPRIQGWLESLRAINERLSESGEKVVDLRDKWEIAADNIRKKLDEKLNNIEFDMRFNFDGADDDLDIQIEKTKSKMKALNDAIVAAGQAGFDKQDELVKNLVKTYGELFEQLKDLEWQKTQDGVTNMFESTSKKLADLDLQYRLFGNTQDYLTSKMKLLKDAINKMITEGIDPEDDRLLELSEQYKEAARAAVLYAESQKQIKDAIKDAIGLGPDQDSRNTMLIRLGEAALELWSKVDTLIRQTAGEAVLWLSGWSSEVLSVFRKALTDSQNFRAAVINEQGAALSNGLDLISTAWDLAEKRYADFVKNVKEDLRATLPAIHNTGISFGSAIEAGMKALVEGIGDVRELMLSAVDGFSIEAKKEFDKTLTFAQELANAMSTAFSDAINKMKSAIGDLTSVTVTFSDKSGSNPPKMAMGGIVPSGFPNDTYPALLTSGEMVIPAPHSLPSAMMGKNMSQQVIYVTLDGRVISQAVFEGLPDVVRMNTGGLQ